LSEAGDDRLLYIATLLHDVGKGSGEDHSVAGARMAVAACKRMGLSANEASTVETLVRHHLLLSDTATRRDIDDGSVIASVAATVTDPDVLRLLYVLSGADGLATGQGSWNGWKASLVSALYRRVLVALGSGELPARSDVEARLRELEAYDPVVAATAEPILTALPPSYLATTSIEDIADDVRLLHAPPAPGQVMTRIDPGFQAGRSVVTVCFADRPGSLARTAGVLTLHRIGVLSAQAYTTEAGSALERFIVAEPEKIDWAKVDADMSAAYSGRLALDARLEQKTQAYKPKDRLEISVRILADESEHSTVVEVRAPDALGLLYALCTAISGLDINIHVAKIDTLGERVVDVFYLRSSDGSKLDEVQGTELITAMKHQVGRLFG
jgi:[protein-PII] uridylyltransferase